MNVLNRNLGRRQFLSISTIVLASSMIAKPSRLLLASSGSPQAAENTKTNGTKYGKYIFSGYIEENQDPERGIFVAYLGRTVIPGAPLCRFVRMPPPGPMPEHGGTETHDIPSFLIHLGNDPDDPFDLGAEAHLYLGTGEDREKYVLTKSTAVYLPSGLWHAPWHVKKIWKPMTFIDIMVGEGEMAASDPSRESPEGGGQPVPMVPPSGPTQEELAKAKTRGYQYDKYMLSGVSKERVFPEGGLPIAYLDCTMFPGAPLTRIMRFQPRDTPYPIIDPQKHKYGTLLAYLGTDYDDPFDLGAEVELCMGDEREKHVFNESTLVYIPRGILFGPWQVKNVRKPFNFLKVVLGPELPTTM